MLQERKKSPALELYVEKLLQWNQKVNLIAKSTEKEVWQRHIEDSLQLLPFLPASAKTVMDLGTGAGLPGIILAIEKPECEVSLVESDLKKCAFLAEIKRSLDLKNVTIFKERIESIKAPKQDVIISRALANLSQLLEWSEALISSEGTAIFLKGKEAKNEIEEAEKFWSFKYKLHPSTTEPKASIVIIQQLRVRL